MRFCFSAASQRCSALSLAIWIVAGGQAGTFDGNFLLVSCLMLALAFALYLIFLVRQAMKPETPQKPAPSVEKKKITADEQQPVGGARS